MLRRTLTALAMYLSLALVPLSAVAHVGHGAPGVAIDLERVDRKGAQLTIGLRLENTSDAPMLLQSFSTELGTVQLVQGDPLIKPGEVTHMVLSLEVQGDMPGLFTLIVDFGEDGAGPVLVFTGA